MDAMQAALLPFLHKSMVMADCAGVPDDILTMM